MHPLASNDTPPCDREPSGVTQDRRVGSVAVYSSHCREDRFSAASRFGRPEEVYTRCSAR